MNDTTMMLLSIQNSQNRLKYLESAVHINNLSTSNNGIALVVLFAIVVGIIIFKFVKVPKS